jgi:predicted dehydrogenase
LGFGNRGQVYASYALKHPDRARVVGFAEPRAHLRNKYLNLYEDTVDSTLIFSDWLDFVKLNRRVASAVVIALPDRIHKEAAVEFNRLGYHMLLEKPMATLLDDCKQITMQCRQMTSQINAVCHCMRYLGPSLKIKKMIDSGIIGDVVHINHTEPVGYWHFAHSYVRGNWHKESDSSFSLLAKCCHDIDILVFWMGKKCTNVSSFGSLQHFKSVVLI